MKSISRFLAAIFFFLLPISFLYGCEQSEVSMVKNAPLPLDKSITFGQLFDTYKYIEKGEWKVLTSDRGQTFVEFRAPLKLAPVVSGVLAFQKELSGDQESYPAEIAKKLMSKGVRIVLIAQFKITSDGKRFTPSYIGFEQQSSTTSPEADSWPMDSAYKTILGNKPFIFIFDYEELKKDITVEFKKLFIQNNKHLFVDYVSEYEVRHPKFNSENEQIGYRTEYCLYYVSVDNVSFDNIELSVNFTNVKASELTKDEFNKRIKTQKEWYFSDINSVNLKTRIVDSKKYILPHEYIEEGPRNFIFYEAKKFTYFLTIEKLSPPEVSIDIQKSVL